MVVSTNKRLLSPRAGLAALIFMTGGLALFSDWPHAEAPAAEAPETPQTIEQAAKGNCLGQLSWDIRELVARSQQTGVSTEMLQVLDYAFCISSEEAVLQEEVRRGLRPEFAATETEQMPPDAAAHAAADKAQRARGTGPKEIPLCVGNCR